MKFSELELQRLMNKGPENLTIEEKITFNILNFVRCNHLTGDDFYSLSYNTQYYGDIEMSFKKNAGSIIGYCKTIIKSEGKVLEYLFTENGFELLSSETPNKASSRKNCPGSSIRPNR